MTICDTKLRNSSSASWMKCIYSLIAYAAAALPSIVQPFVCITLHNYTQLEYDEIMQCLHAMSAKKIPMARHSTPSTVAALIERISARSIQLNKH